MEQGRRYSKEVKERAVRLVLERQGRIRLTMVGHQLEDAQGRLHPRDFEALAKASRA